MISCSRASILTCALGEAQQLKKSKVLIFLLSTFLSIRLKQTIYPVVFLTRGGREFYPMIKDLRMCMVEGAAFFAASAGLAGINSHATDIILEPQLVGFVKDLNLLMFVWDGYLNPEQIGQLQEMKVNGVIYDEYV